MALSCFPHISKRIALGDGTHYAYAYAPASASKPTFLLLHGFPSSSYDWRHQVHALAAKGFGVLAPDLLGYGDTDSPPDVEAYSLKRMSDHLAEILANEGIQKVIGVGHDWGCGLLSSFCVWHAKCLMALTFISVGYMEPSDVAMDVDAANAMTKEAFGYSTFGYWKLFDTPEAAGLLEGHVGIFFIYDEFGADMNPNPQPESVTSLVYPAKPEAWKSILGPVGAAEAWVSSDQTSPLPAWLSAGEATTHREIMSKKGYTGPLNWYKSAIRGVDSSTNASLSESRKHIDLPTLLVVSDRDYITRADMQKERMVKWVQHLRIEELSCGHWVQLELPDKLNELLEGFANEVAIGIING
ncbi:hypothetical protein MMC17_005385 [Xylographa soralifera]|nr:hypothetical protein [Xylographa soralifera]